jgi:hypothetical protein
MLTLAWVDGFCWRDVCCSPQKAAGQWLASLVRWLQLCSTSLCQFNSDFSRQSRRASDRVKPTCDGCNCTNEVQQNNLLARRHVARILLVPAWKLKAEVHNRPAPQQHATQLANLIRLNTTG